MAQNTNFFISSTPVIKACSLESGFRIGLCSIGQSRPPFRRMCRMLFRCIRCCPMNGLRPGNIGCRGHPIRRGTCIVFRMSRSDNSCNCRPRFAGIESCFGMRPCRGSKSPPKWVWPPGRLLNVASYENLLWYKAKTTNKLVVRRLITIFRNCVAYLIFHNPPDRKIRSFIFVCIIKWVRMARHLNEFRRLNQRL